MTDKALQDCKLLGQHPAWQSTARCCHSMMLPALSSTGHLTYYDHQDLPCGRALTSNVLVMIERLLQAYSPIPTDVDMLGCRHV
jgi:hypothetical protein